LDLLNKFKEYNKKEVLFKNEDNILLGVSGGPDSLTMLNLFLRIKKIYNLNIVVFHLNHKFREEAGEEAVYVKSICQKSNIPVIIKEYDVPALIKREALSPEEAARKIRFSLMQKEARNYNISKIALAHNKDDLVETILLHMFRGTGLKGLSGIDPVTEINGIKIIHPLLNTSRYEIEQYCQEYDLEPRFDKSNESTIYTRNKIRLDIIPYLEKNINPGLKDVMFNMSELIRKENSFMSNLTKDFISEILIEEGNNLIRVDIIKLKDSPEVLRMRAIQKVIYKLKDKEVNVYNNHLKLIGDLIFTGNTGNMLDLPDDIKVKKSYDSLIFTKGNIEINFIKFDKVMEIPGKIIIANNQKLESSLLSPDKDWEKNKLNPNICFFDIEEVSLPIRVRNRKDGDRFIPLGMSGFKKVKDFFIDEKLPLEQRDMVPVITDKNDKIIWLAGLRMDERVKITDKTNKIGKIIYKNRRKKYE